MHTRSATHSVPQQEHLQEMRKTRQIGGEPAFGRLSEQKKEINTVVDSGAESCSTKTQT